MVADSIVFLFLMYSLYQNRKDINNIKESLASIRQIADIRPIEGADNKVSTEGEINVKLS